MDYKSKISGFRIANPKERLQISKSSARITDYKLKKWRRKNDGYYLRCQFERLAWNCNYERSTSDDIPFCKPELLVIGFKLQLREEGCHRLGGDTI